MKMRSYCASEDDGDQQQQLLPLCNHCAVCRQENRTKTHFDEVIFSASCMTLLLVLQLPMSSFHGRPVLVFGFGSLPCAFHAFLICLAGACFGSVCSIHIRKTRPMIARFYYAFAVLSMVSSFVIAFSAAVWEMYKALLPVFAGNAA